MPAPKRTDAIATNVRLPRDLHKFLKKEAKRQRIPFNQLVIDRLAGADADREASLLARLSSIFEPMMYRAMDIGARTGALTTLAAFKDTDPAKIELEQRLREFQDDLGRIRRRWLEDAMAKKFGEPDKADEK